MDITVQAIGVQDAIKMLNLVEKSVGSASHSALEKAAVLVQREAKRNAPKSPKRVQLNRLRKTRRKVTRKARATSRPAPGGLENSIEREVGSDEAKVYVASNSAAGKYAKRIHDEKGSTWRSRGVGTIAKGARADDKFIERAIVDNSGRIEQIIKAEHKKAGLYEL